MFPYFIILLRLTQSNFTFEEERLALNGLTILTNLPVCLLLFSV